MFAGRYEYQSYLSLSKLINRELQCPTWGYPTEGAYYRDAASTDAMLNIRIPFFTVQAEDDPVCHLSTSP